jgi:cytochrome bd ubiquinol oxidase subunit I
MQFPAGMTFNPDTARSEMLNFWEVLLSPMAVHKFLHTISSGYVISALFVLCVSSWYLIKKREELLAKRSMAIAGVFGLLAAVFLAVTGDGSAYTVAQKQPAKLAAMEGLYNGQRGAGLVVFGVLKGEDRIRAGEDPYHMKMEIPRLLSLLGYRSSDAFVPGIHDLVRGNAEHNILSAGEKIKLGRIAVASLSEYKQAKKEGRTKDADSARAVFEAHYAYMGYGYLNDPESIIPNVPLTFYSFHLMVGLGFYFILLFAVQLFLTVRNRIENKKLLLRIIMLTLPLGFIASQAGWIVAEVGRQPWVIQDLMPTAIATSNIDASAVMTTFFLFAALFTILLIAEIKIMLTSIKSGPKGGSHV